MPQSNINIQDTRVTELTFEQERGIYQTAKDAAVFGLLSEWLRWYTAGIQQGMHPMEAANEAAFEWDI